MARMLVREEQEAGRTPDCTGNNHPKAEPVQMGAGSIAVLQRGMRRKNQADPQQRGQHREAAPDQQGGGWDHRTLHISQDRSERDAGDQGNLAYGNQLSQLRRLYCRLVVQLYLRSGDRISCVNGSAKPLRLSMKSARIMPQIRIATISVLLITTASQRAFIRTSGSVKSIFMRAGNGLDAAWCGARGRLSQTRADRSMVPSKREHPAAGDVFCRPLSVRMRSSSCMRNRTVAAPILGSGMRARRRNAHCVTGAS